jgi:DNA-binding transcriptional ArsR family regulator
MSREQNRPITDLGTLKALAHPLRMQLYRGLCVARVATASHLADQVDEAVSLVSYHLRKLAEHGLIEEAEPQSGDGRERWWRPSSEGVSIRDRDFRDGSSTSSVPTCTAATSTSAPPGAPSGTRPPRTASPCCG